MRMGTTPTHTFTLPIDTQIVSKVRVLYAQNGVVKITKEECEASMNGNTLKVTLTQEETLRLDYNLKTDIQVRILTLDGDALVSNIISVSTGRCLSDEVL